MTETSRPAEFDNAIVQWLPFLRKLAFKMERNAQDREDIIQDTIANAMLNWESFRPEASMPGWLAFRMRSVISGKRKKAARRFIESELQDIHGVPAMQDSAVQARSALSAIRDNRAETALVRLAMGDTMEEIGSDLGVTRERVRQITNTARARMAKRVKWRVAA